MRGCGVILTACMALVLGGCGPEPPGEPGADKSPATVRAARRAYDGAPPVIAHASFGITCTQCHDERGVSVKGVGFAPPSPHAQTLGMGAASRCQQCHVFRRTDRVFVDSDFVGLEQDLRHGDRASPLAPPTIPHATFMREDCLACHGGPAAREAIRTSHPERARCRQCHVPVQTTERFPGS